MKETESLEKSKTEIRLNMKKLKKLNEMLRGTISPIGWMQWNKEHQIIDTQWNKCK